MLSRESILQLVNANSEFVIHYRSRYLRSFFFVKVE